MNIEQAAALPWPDPALVQHQYHGSGRDRPRYMKHKTEGWEYPGPTSILKVWDKEGLMKWAADVEREACMEATEQVYGRVRGKGMDLEPAAFIARVEDEIGGARASHRKRQKAADIGTAAHSLVEWHVRRQLGLKVGPEPQVPDESLIAVMAWEDAWKAHGYTPVRVEQPVWSHTHDYAGTVDYFLLDPAGRLGIMDLKTSKGIYTTQHLQLAAYCKATEELLGVPVEWAELWRIPKTLEGDCAPEIVQLGEMKIWTGSGHKTVVASREDLVRSFLGIKSAWDVLCDMRRLAA